MHDQMNAERTTRPTRPLFLAKGVSRSFVMSTHQYSRWQASFRRFWSFTFLSIRYIVCQTGWRSQKEQSSWKSCRHRAAARWLRHLKTQHFLPVLWREPWSLDAVCANTGFLIITPIQVYPIDVHMQIKVSCNNSRPDALSYSLELTRQGWLGRSVYAIHPL